MTLNDYYTALGVWLPTLPSLPVSNVYAAINLARRSMAAWTDVTMTITSPTGTAGGTLNAGQSGYPYPQVNGVDILSIYKVWCYNGNLRWPLNKVPAGEYPYSNFSGIPDRFYLQNRSVNYWPIPANNWQSDWKVSLQPTTLVNPLDVDGQITEEYADATVFVASKFTALSDTNASLAEVYQSIYTQLLDMLPRNRL